MGENKKEGKEHKTSAAESSAMAQYPTADGLEFRSISCFRRRQKRDLLYRMSKTIKPGFTPATFQETESEDEQTDDMQAATDTSTQEQQVEGWNGCRRGSAGDTESQSQEGTTSPEGKGSASEGLSMRSSSTHSYHTNHTICSSYMLTTYASAAETGEKTTKNTKTPKPAAEEIPGLKISQTLH
ncbi:hypothetical protein LZ554_008648 [Drepanopeziza brunnea f. sp. 'monogermtubi']|nr:hypothetical protein LZ554_008648 [Drepanopeziza brunnea f. sp. 'monogermtubi']